ncbi:hypothetical protein K2173_004190 [Erythroxylum novogranatense]|uniref:Glycosyl transferase family 1 domain-containing protein n=1 Tax=Erythroxylum novogranatense TaxID=1862640 RepID=A0AAV8SYR1_9ROSI|nr:hypothetical protein K2173_004190 [Erythroxylum novogranatense]
MARSITPPNIEEADGNGNGNDQASHSIRDRLRFKRNPNCDSRTSLSRGGKSAADRAASRGRWHHGSNRRRGLFRGVYLCYLVIFFAVFAFAMASVVLQSSIADMVSKGWSEHRRSSLEGLRFGTTLKFFNTRRSRLFAKRQGLDEVRLQVARVGLRPPRLAVILGNMKKDPWSLMLVTVMKNLQELGYEIRIYAVENGNARSMWEQVGSQTSFLGPERYNHIDWSIFEGVIVDSFETKEAISSLMQEPFFSIPIIWIIQEDILANRLLLYENKGWQHLISAWRTAFNRANVVVFSDFTLPMLYNVLDTGNFFVIPGSPVDVWSAESYIKTHAKQQIRMDNRYNKDDVVVLIIGSSFFYDELSWDYSVLIRTIGPLLVKYAKSNDAEGSFKFVFLCGNSNNGDALQEIVSRLGLLHDSVRHYGFSGDINSVLLMADIILYGSSQDEQGFPPLIIRAMTFGIPVVMPDIPIISKYMLQVTDGSNGILFAKDDSEDLMRIFSLLISDGKLSKYAQDVSFSGKLLAKNMLASECITGYAKLLENVLSFPSDALLPDPASQLQQKVWEWNLFGEELGQENSELPGMEMLTPFRESSVILSIEEEMNGLVNSTNMLDNGHVIEVPDIPTESDWDVLQDIESAEEYEKLENDEFEERMDRSPGVWDEIYRNARKSEKLKFEVNERDEGELERTGQPVCIYEVYSGAGSWPFLHHGSLYRGLSLSTKARRPRSDDVDAVSRLPLLNDSYYRDILCEMGGMFSIANMVDSIHSRPWIGFQSWRAAGRKVSLSVKAEKVLEEKIQKETKGDVVYFWTLLDMDSGATSSSDQLSFWSMCDILNAGHCRTAFEDTFRHMYSLPLHLEALPPMPEDGGHWSALHSWVMPTPSFLEFIMFSRMFVDSLDALQTNSRKVIDCRFGSSELEKRHCYCRILEFLINVWAYHSARKMVYIDPHTGSFEEQHPIEQRKGIIWAKYFNLTLLKRMDEDLAEAADDGDHPRESWLWPSTGEVHWQGIYDREREQRYRIKMDKKRKTREKLYERIRSGYKQKPLGG